ncbi:MAG: TldD/PmbA family protein [bacterium]
MKDLSEYIPDLSDLSDTDYYDIRLERNLITSIIYHNDEPQEVSENILNGGCIRVLYKGGWGFSSFTDLNSLKKNISEAKSLAKSIPNGAGSILPDEGKRISIKRPGNKDPKSIPLRDKILKVKETGEMLRQNENINISFVGYSDISRQMLLTNKFGTFIDRDEVMTKGIIMGISTKTGEPLRSTRSANYWRGFEVFEELVCLIPEIVEEIGYLLSAENAKGGTYDVIIDPMLSGVFAHESFGHTDEADFFYKDDRLREILKIGRKIGSSTITIIDGPLKIDSAGDILYDDEGVEAKETVLIENGVLKNHLHSRETASIMGEELTGNARAINFFYPPIVRMTNTYIKPGKATLEELIRELKNGLVVYNSIGGSGGEMFTFSAVYGHKVENGKITKPVKNLTLTGNLFNTLNNIVACSNDVKIFTSWGGCGKIEQSPLPVGIGGPYVMIKNAIIGGR